MTFRFMNPEQEHHSSCSSQSDFLFKEKDARIEKEVETAGRKQ